MQTSARRMFRQFTSREIETIQRVQITLPAASASASVTPSPAVDWTRTLIEIAGWYNGFGGGTDNDVPDQSFYLDINGADVRANRTVGTGDTEIYVDLVTMRRGVIRRIQRSVVTAASVATADFALGNKVDVSKTQARWLGTISQSAFGTAWPGWVTIHNESTLRFQRGTTDGTSSASVEAAERY